MDSKFNGLSRCDSRLSSAQAMRYALKGGMQENIVVIARQEARIAALDKELNGFQNGSTGNTL